MASRNASFPSLLQPAVLESGALPRDTHVHVSLYEDGDRSPSLVSSQSRRNGNKDGPLLLAAEPATQSLGLADNLPHGQSCHSRDLCLGLAKILRACNDLQVPVLGRKGHGGIGLQVEVFWHSRSCCPAPPRQRFWRPPPRHLLIIRAPHGNAMRWPQLKHRRAILVLLDGFRCRHSILMCVCQHHSYHHTDVLTVSTAASSSLNTAPI